jgi:alcohol dehydrogenase class IV
MQTRLREVDIPESALPKMAQDAMLQTRLLVNNPRPLHEADAFSIYKEAW